MKPPFFVPNSAYFLPMHHSKSVHVIPTNCLVFRELVTK